MRSTIDKAGRVVVPKQLREQAGLVPGEVEITIDGSGLRLEPVAGTGVVEEAGRLVIPAAGTEIDDDMVQNLRDAGRP
ncbi:MAG: AbrB/MazE/SpoVT family DNA-binding domain-containing protein [Microthrixaceae bacterium]